MRTRGKPVLPVKSRGLARSRRPIRRARADVASAACERGLVRSRVILTSPFLSAHAHETKRPCVRAGRCARAAKVPPLALTVHGRDLLAQRPRAPAPPRRSCVPPRLRLRASPRGGERADGRGLGAGRCEGDGARPVQRAAPADPERIQLGVHVSGFLEDQRPLQARGGPSHRAPGPGARLFPAPAAAARGARRIDAVPDTDDERRSVRERCDQRGNRRTGRRGRSAEAEPAGADGPQDAEQPEHAPGDGGEAAARPRRGRSRVRRRAGRSRPASTPGSPSRCRRCRRRSSTASR